MYELKWSHAEKTVARRAFDLALGRRELEAIILETKKKGSEDRGTLRVVGPGKLVDGASAGDRQKVRLSLLRSAIGVRTTASGRSSDRR
jgi:hypothetical protein